MKFFRKLKASLLKRYYLLTNGGYSVGSAYGGRFLIDWTHPIDKKLVTGLYENILLTQMIDLLNRHQPDLFLDIGAHSGIYSLIAKRTRPDCCVHAFEPDIENLSQLQANLFLNKLAESIQVHPYGLSERSGEVYFDATDNTSRGTRMISATGNRKIAVKRLDDVLTAEDKSAFLKIDVEGHEAAVLEGGKTFLARNKCIIQIELFTQNFDQVTAQLKEFGYSGQLAHGTQDYYFTNFPLKFASF